MTRILIVEDEVITALALGNELIRLGHTVCSLAASSSEVMRIAENERPEVAIMDLNLGNSIDGLELAQLLYERHTIPSLIVSGYPRSQIGNLDHEFCLGYLSKPVHTDEIVTLLERMHKQPSEAHCS